MRQTGKEERDLVKQEKEALGRNQYCKFDEALELQPPEGHGLWSTFPTCIKLVENSLKSCSSSQVLLQPNDDSSEFAYPTAP